MEKFIARENIEHFLRLIEHEPDFAKRDRLMQMLAEQGAKLSTAETGSVEGEVQPCTASHHTRLLPGLQR